MRVFFEVVLPPPFCCSVSLGSDVSEINELVLRSNKRDNKTIFRCFFK